MATEKGVKEGFLAGGAGAAAVGVGLVLLLSSGNSGNTAPSTTSHSYSAQPSHGGEASHSNSRVSAAPETTRALGGITFFGVEVSDSGDGADLRICDADGTLFTSASQAEGQTINALTDMGAAIKAGDVPCDITSGSAVINSGYADTTSKEVGGIFRGTLEGDGSSGNLTSLTQVEPAHAVH